MKLFRILFKSASWFAVSAVAISIVDAITSIGLIALIQRILTKEGAASNTSFIIFAALCVTVLITKVVSQMVLTRVAERSISSILLSLCRRIAAAPLRELERVGPHRALSAITVDVGVLASTIQGIPVLIGNALALIFGLTYLCWLSPYVMLGAVAFIIFGYSSYKWTASFATKYIRTAREHQDELTKGLRSLIDGAKELRMHHDRMDGFLADAIEANNQKVRANQTIGYTIQGAAVSWGRLIFFIAIGLLLFAANRAFTIDEAELTACTLTILFLMTPVERIIAWLPLLARAKIATEKIEAFGKFDLEVELRSHKPPFNSFQKLVITDLQFEYDRLDGERNFRFGPIDFQLTNGEVVFLVGGNGCGKTTFLKLLTGLYEPQSGRITLDDVDITEDNRDCYRQLFSVVFAEPVLFEFLHGLGWQQVDYVQDLLQQLELTSKVMIENGRLSTIDLSKGQRKRLALLTAYLEDRPIYVFDEWAADQDPLYKRVFYEEILPALQQRGKTVVVISHDDQYFSKADRIVHLVDGSIASIEPVVALESN